MPRLGFGVDIGGTGIKGAVVDLDTGEFHGERHRIPTPHPGTPDAVADVVAEIVRTFEWPGPFGVTVPGVVKGGTTRYVGNLDGAWVGVDAASLFAERLGRPVSDVTILNDADAAGLAEMRFGDESFRRGVVVVLTFGTGIGSALFVDGRLVPNTEFGHIEVDGRDGEDDAAASVRDNLGLSWQQWAPRVSKYLAKLEAVLWPDLIVVGGGVSKKAHKWVPLLSSEAPIAVATLKNHAGIVGAGLAASDVR